MGRRSRDGDAHVTLFTMHKVLAQAFSKSTDTAVIAMIDALVAVVVPELAFRAKVPSCVFLAIHACLGGGLRCVAQHT